MYQFRLPDIGEGVAEAEVVKWQVGEGDFVAADQPIVEVMTDKASVEISSPRGGRVHRLCGREGDMIAVGDTLIEIDDEVVSENGAGDDDSTTAARTLTPTAQPGSEAPLHHRPPPMPERPHLRVEATAERQNRAQAVPAVRELAKQLRVDLDQVTGTGPDGRVMRRDVEAFSESAENGTHQAHAAAVASADAASVEDELDWNRQPLRGMRRLIAEHMVRSSRSIPHFSFVVEVDVTDLEERRKQLAEGQETSPLAFAACAVVRVLPDYPQINASVDEEREEVIYKGRVHLGIAVATEEGLMVPVIRNAEGRSAIELAATIADLSQRARAKGLGPAELKGSTFTITSLGKLGGVMGTPIINHPESAIMAVHAIRTLPRYIDGKLLPRQVFNLSVSLDHRIVDGFECAQFMQDVMEVLQLADFPEFK